jgi:beta-N-acetylhexosaminidase
MTSSRRPETQARDSVLARFLLGFHGTSLPSELAGYLERGLAGVVLYPRNFRDVHELHNLAGQIRAAAKRPVLIGIDQEGGTRFALAKPFTQWPSATELGALGDPHITEQVARAMAVELRAVGCNVDFAPMLDLNHNPDSPVTKDRSFGADPLRVAGLGVAFDRGLRAGRVLPCAKHFPGHGDVAVDPHVQLPVYAGTLEQLQAADLVPFAAAIRAGVPLVMTAHILLPKIERDRPASLSRIILHDLLRHGMKFRGVILADDLGMGAIAHTYGPGQAAVETFQAGTDIAMLCHDWSLVAPAIEAVRRARAAGAFDDSEWEASLERIDATCALAERHPPRMPLDVLGCEEFLALSARVREASHQR